MEKILEYIPQDLLGNIYLMDSKIVLMSVICLFSGNQLAMLMIENPILILLIVINLADGQFQV
jgi:hypothetical protein